MLAAPLGLCDLKKQKGQKHDMSHLDLVLLCLKWRHLNHENEPGTGNHEISHKNGVPYPNIVINFINVVC